MGVAELRGVCVCVHEWLLKHVKCVIGHIGVMVQSNYIQYVQYSSTLGCNTSKSNICYQ